MNEWKKWKYKKKSQIAILQNKKSRKIFIFEFLYIFSYIKHEIINRIVYKVTVNKIKKSCLFLKKLLSSINIGI